MVVLVRESLADALIIQGFGMAVCPDNAPGKIFLSCGLGASHTLALLACDRPRNG